MLSPLGRSAESAVRAGIDWTTRKVATPARTTRIRIPAPVALPENRRSPIRRTVRRAGACEVVVTPAPRARDGGFEGSPPGPGRPDGPGRRGRPGPPVSRSESLRRDRVDRLLALLAQGVRDRRGAGLVGRGLLAVRADHVALEGLDQLGGVGVVVLDAADVVADEDQRVLALVGRRPVDVVGEVVLPTTGLDLRAFDDRGGTLGGRRHPVAADLDVGDAELTGLALVGVADRALTGLHGADHAGRAVRRLAALGRPLVDGGAGPRVRGRLGQVVGEVLRGARLVTAVHGGDRRAGQLRVRVVGLDRRVVPGGDRPGEDLGDRVGRQVELVDAREVVDDGDRRDVVRQLEDLAAGAAVLGLRDLVVAEVGVRAGEVDAAGQELLAATAGAHRVVVHRDVGLLLAEPGGPALHGRLLRTGTRTVQGAAQLLGAAAGVAAPAAGVRLVGGAARGEREGAGERHRRKGDALGSEVRRGAELQLDASRHGPDVSAGRNPTFVEEAREPKWPLQG